MLSSEQGLSKIEPTSITNILTLRYDPSIKPNLPKKTWSDFKPSIQNPSIEFIEKSIQKNVKNTVFETFLNRFQCGLACSILHHFFQKHPQTLFSQKV